MTTETLSFDLVDEPWIRTVDRNSTVRLLSIRETFRQASELSGLVGELPTQAFAILRLLLAILRSSIRHRRGGALDIWAALWPEAGWPIGEIEKYLDEHRARFDLFDRTEPFFQVAGLRAAGDAVSSLDKIIADVPNGAKYFTTRAGKEVERIGFAEAARWLVHVHSYDPSGIKTGAVGDPRVKNGKGYPIGVAWTGALGGVFLEGETLRETLLLNLVLLGIDGERFRDDDLPAWERRGDGPTIRPQPLPTGPADLATWQSRRVRLVPAKKHVTGVVLCNGDPLEPFNQHRLEPMTGWRYSPNQSKKAGQNRHYPATHDPERSVWRGMSALLEDLANPGADGEFGITAGVVRWAQRLVEDDVLAETHPIRLHAVGMEYISNQSVVGEIVDDTIGFRVGVLSDPELRSCAVAAVRAAEQAVGALGNLAANLARAAGIGTAPGSTDGPRDRAREEGYFALEAPYRAWLAQLDPRAGDYSEYSRIWHRSVRPIAELMAADLIQAAGKPAWVGRDSESGRMDSARAEQLFRAALAKALPLAFGPRDDNDGDSR